MPNNRKLHSSIGKSEFVTRRKQVNKNFMHRIEKHQQSLVNHMPRPIHLSLRADNVPFLMKFWYYPLEVQFKISCFLFIRAIPQALNPLGVVIDPLVSA